MLKDSKAIEMQSIMTACLRFLFFLGGGYDGGMMYRVSFSNFHFKRNIDHTVKQLQCNYNKKLAKYYMD